MRAIDHNLEIVKACSVRYRLLDRMDISACSVIDTARPTNLGRIRQLELSVDECFDRQLVII